MKLILKLVILKIVFVFNFVLISNSSADNHNIYETLEIIKNDLKTLERAVYSGSIEIENTISKHPAVSLAAVVAKPDEKWGETPCAFVELIEGKSSSEEEIIKFCRETLAGFKLPKKVVFAPLPKTSTGKIQKFELRKQAKELN